MILRFSAFPPCRAVTYWRQQGSSAFFYRLLAKLRGEAPPIGPRDGYETWVTRYQTLSKRDRRAIRSHIEKMERYPIISVVLAPYDGEPKFLAETIASLQEQLYPHWELLLPVEPKQAVADPRIKIVPSQERLLDAARGEFVSFLRADDLLAPHALYMAAVECLDHGDSGLIYSDEDWVGQNGTPIEPYFKPDWDQELFYSRTYIDSLCVIRRTLLDGSEGSPFGSNGWLAPAFLYRIAEKLSAEQIRHIPMVLYHHRQAGSSGNAPTNDRHSIEIRGVPVEVSSAPNLTGPRKGWRIHYPLPDPLPLVSVIVPTRDRVDLLRACIDGLLDGTDYPALDIIVIDNESGEAATLAYFQEITQRGVRVFRAEGPFNYSAFHNHIIALTRGTHLALLNNDVKVIHSDWLREMVSHAVRPDVGAVGAKLYFPDDTIQHAGVVMGVFGCAGHLHHRLPDDMAGNQDDHKLVHEVSAVTAACMVLRKSLYEEVGGFDEHSLKVVFNDVDLCLKIRAKGYRNIWTPFAELYHFESASRGTVMKPEDVLRERRERETLRQRWGQTLLVDPYYNPNLTHDNVWCTLATPPRIRKPWK